MIDQVTVAYQPDFVSPPGDTILELLEEQNMTQSGLAQRMGRPVKTVNEIIHGKKSLTPETALQLELVLGAPARIWLNLEQQYREHLARQAEDEALQEQLDWLALFPVKDMQNKGWLPTTTNESELLVALLQFFGLANPNSWEDIWSGCLVNYRKTSAYESTDYALSTWLRQGERQAQTIRCAPYDVTAFMQLLQNEIRLLTLETPAVFESELVNLCARVGVVVTFVPQVTGARVSGATRWLNKEKALIQLSLRYKTNDHFWFTFFHEAGHIARHGKRAVFIDSENGVSDGKEQEADEFARDMLVPPKLYRQFVNKNKKISKTAVLQFSKNIGIAPGIVVGRLQHDGMLPYTHLNGLKGKFSWAEYHESQPIYNVP